MPIIASETIYINVKKDRSIEVKLLEKLGHNQCVDISSIDSTNSERDQLHDIVKKLTGERVIECDNGICCASKNYDSFVSKLKGLGE